MTHLDLCDAVLEVADSSLGVVLADRQFFLETRQRVA